VGHFSASDGTCQRQLLPPGISDLPQTRSRPMLNSQRDSARLALALLRMEGVGRVATGRLVARFPTPDVLRATPHEQVRVRLRGVPAVDDIIRRLSTNEFDRLLEDAGTALDRMAARQIDILTARHPHWPMGLSQLDWAERPAVLYCFGKSEVLLRPSVAFIAHPPLEVHAFELAQVLVRHLIAQGRVPVAGLQHGFDTVVCKLASSAAAPAISVGSTGLARVPGPMRPPAAAMVRNGGLLLSSFAVEHGPFPHDDVERARVMVAIASVTVVVSAPSDTAEARAVETARDLGRPVIDLTRSDLTEANITAELAQALSLSHPSDSL